LLNVNYRRVQHTNEESCDACSDSNRHVRDFVRTLFHTGIYRIMLRNRAVQMKRQCAVPIKQSIVRDALVNKHKRRRSVYYYLRLHCDISFHYGFL
jgi:hypothetical protein